MANPSRIRSTEMRLYDRQKQRLYVNAAERARFLTAAKACETGPRTFALTLLYTGCRISEALELSPSAVQLSARIITFRTLKKREKLVMREVPIPEALADDLSASFRLGDHLEPDRHLWRHRGKRLTRAVAYRWIKEIMSEAGIEGAQACPKGLRHGYGVHAMRSGVQLNMLSKWMGHASLSTTAIYANASGREEQEIAARMWT